MQLQKINCANCGAAVDWDGTFGKTVKCSYCGSTFMPAATELDGVWMMTDPVARARYEFAGTMNKLEHDIRYEVMRGQDWSAYDRAFLTEINRLEEAGLVRRLASFWSVSPHPPIYRARDDGEFILGEQRLPFQKGEEIIWACPMTRDRFELDLPVLIADLHDARIQDVCGIMVNAMQGRMT